MVGRRRRRAAARRGGCVRTVERGPEPIPTRIVVDPLALSAIPIGDRGTIIYFQEDRFRSGDTVATLIERLGADEDEAAPILRSSRAARPFRLLLPGTTVKTKVDGAGKLRSLWFLSDRDTILSVDRLERASAASSSKPRWRAK